MPVTLQSVGADLTDIDTDAQNAFNAISSAENSNPQYNNPLDLAEGDQGYGTFGAGITIFPTVAAGVAAGVKQVQLMESNASGVYQSDESINDVAQSYAPGAQATTWANNVANALGVSPSAPLFGNTTAQANSGNVVSDALSSTISAATNGAASTVTGYVQQYLGRAVAIGLGLLLIAAGVFSFDKIQTVVVGAAREGARAAVA